MSETPVPTSLKRTVRRVAADRSGEPSLRTPWTFEGLHRVEIVAPDPECAAMLVEYASPLFRAKLVAGAQLSVQLQPLSAEPGWAVVLLALVDRWLEAVPLPCTNLIYGGRRYLIRAATHVEDLVVAPTDSAVA